MRALTAVLCFRPTNWDHPDAVGWYPYDFTTADVYAASSRRSEQRRALSGVVPHTRVGLLTLEGEDRTKAATDRAQRETASAVAEECQSWDRATKARKKWAIW